MAAILIALVFGMVMIETDFFNRGESGRYTEVTENSHKIDLLKFSIITPQTFKYIEQEGIDSYVIS